MEEMKGTLYVIATPIGNLEDITLRALKIIREVDAIAAEDTRHTRKLLTHYGISRPLISYYEPKEEVQARKILEMLQRGSKIALVSDAGTPGIADPGYRLVRLAIERSIPVIPIPGPCAFVAALSASGLPTDSFSFFGYPPRKNKERHLFFLRLKREERTLVLYESPRRLLATLKTIKEVMGDAEIVIARELTKVHEEFIRGRVSSILESLSWERVRGEVIIMIRAERAEEERPLLEIIKEYHERYGLPIKDAVKLVAEEKGVPKGEVYREALKLREGR